MKHRLIDDYIRKIIIDKHYDHWLNNPKINKLESLLPQFDDLYIFDTIENDLRVKRDWFTEEQINSIGWEERFEIIRYLMECRTHHSIYDEECYVDYLIEDLRKYIINKSWSVLFDKYALLYVATQFNMDDTGFILDEIFEKITNAFSVRTAIAKIKRNKLFILGLSMKLSMRDCGLNII